MLDQEGELINPAADRLVRLSEAEKVGYALMRQRFASVRHDMLQKISNIHHALALAEDYLKRDTPSPSDREHLQRRLQDALDDIGYARRTLRFDLGAEAAGVDAMMVPWLTMIQEQEPRQVAVLPLLQAILFGLKPDIVRRASTVKIIADPELRILSHDECLALILRVLLDTAVKGAATKSDIEIVWKRQEAMGFLSIKTTGSTISRSDESRMFALVTGTPETLDDRLHERYQARSIAQALGYEIAFQQRGTTQEELSERELKLIVPAALIVSEKTAAA